MPNLRGLLSGLATAGGQAFQGYGIDQQTRVKNAMAEQEARRAADRDKVLASVGASQITENNARAHSLMNPAAPEPRVPPPLRGVLGTGTNAGKPVTRIAGPDGTTSEVPEYEAPKAAPQPNLVTSPDDVRIPDVPGAVVKGSGGGTFGSAAMRKAVVQNQQQIAVIDEAIQALRDNPKATGILRGVGLIPGMGELAGQINQRVDPAGEAARNPLQNVESLTFLDRSGKAVTRNEMARQGFIPNVASTSESNIEKLESLKRWANAETSFLEAQLQASGQRTQPGGAAGGAAPPAGGARKSVADRDAELRAQGMPAAERRRILASEGYNVQ